MFKATYIRGAAHLMSSREKALEIAKSPMNKYSSVYLGDPPQQLKFALDNEHEVWLLKCFLHNLACFRLGVLDDKLKAMDVNVEGLTQPVHPGPMP